MRNPNLFKVLLLLIFASFAFSACSTYNTVYYGDANYFSQAKHIKKPMYKDSARSEVTASGSYTQSTENTYNIGESLSFGEGAISFAHSRKYFSAAYSLGGYYGNYKVANTGGHSGNKNFYGLSLTLDLSLFAIQNSGSDGFRLTILGLQTTVFSEFGEFYNFRREIDGLKEGNNEYENLSPANVKLAISLYSEIQFMVSEDFDMGFAFGLGGNSAGSIVSFNGFAYWKNFIINFQHTIGYENEQYTLQFGYKLFDSYKSRK
jgi:hypothetical protein